MEHLTKQTGYFMCYGKYYSLKQLAA